MSRGEERDARGGGALSSRHKSETAFAGAAHFERSAISVEASVGTPERGLSRAA